MKKILKQLFNRNDLKKLCDTVISAIGMFGFPAMIVSYFPSSSVQYFRAFFAIGCIAGILSHLFFYKKIISHHIWVRRLICLCLSLCSIILCFYTFGAVDFSTKNLLIYLISGIVLLIGGGSLTFFLADRAEKKAVENINEKLKKNE